ncbi:hypothetical protein ACFL4R_00125 [Nitrospirota bacterium]
MKVSSGSFKLIYLLPLAVAIIHSIGTLNGPTFGPDSWSYFELSKSVFNDFYKVNTWRQYQVPGEYGISFPPLWPTTLAVFNQISDFGIYSGYLLNILLTAGIFWALCMLSRAVFKSYAYGPLMFSGLVLNFSYMNEIRSARSLPLALLLIVLMLYFYFKEQHVSLRSVKAIGILAGLEALTRFDFLLAGAMFGFVLIYMSPRERIRVCYNYYLSYLLALSPWIIYSLYRFKKPFISDNTRTVLASTKTHVTYYFTEPLPTIFDEPGRWIVKTYENIFIVLWNIADRALVKNPLLIILILAVAILFAVYYRNISNKEHAGHDNNVPNKLLMLLPVFIMLNLSVTITGYFYGRYFISTYIYIILSLLYMSSRFSHSLGREAAFKKALYVIVTFFLIARIGVFYSGHDFNPALNKEFIENTKFNELSRVINLSVDEPRVLIINDTTMSAFMFGALTETKSFTDPLNLDEETLMIFIQQFGITHVVTSDQAIVKTLQTQYGTELLDRNHYVYLLRSRKND